MFGHGKSDMPVVARDAGHCDFLGVEDQQMKNPTAATKMKNESFLYDSEF
jgi:hypothetical protein